MKKRIALFLTVITTVSMLTGCGASSSSKSDSYSAYATEDSYEYWDEDWDAAEWEEAAGAYEAAPTAAETVDDSASESSKQKSDRKLIRTINLDVETYDFDSLTSTISAKVDTLGGYIESSSIYGDASIKSRTASYTIRIPAENADSFVGTVEKGSNITSRSESMEDVTLTYVDIQSRKESLEVEYKRLEELLLDAEDITELIYIEDRMSEVRYEIQSIESQLRTYDNKVNYTTIYLYVDEVYEYTEPEVVTVTFGQRLGKELKTAFKNIWEGIQNLTIFVIVSIPYLILIAIPLGLIYLFVVGVSKSIIKKRERKAQSMAAIDGTAVTTEEPSEETADTVEETTEKTTEESSVDATADNNSEGNNE